MRAKEIRALPKEELTNKLSELKRELIKNNAQIATGTTPKSPGQMRELKKTIARILTIEREPPLKKTKELPKKEEVQKPKAKPSNESEKGLEKSKASQKVKPKEEKTEE